MNTSVTVQQMHILAYAPVLYAVLSGLLYGSVKGRHRCARNMDDNIFARPASRWALLTISILLVLCGLLFPVVFWNLLVLIVRGLIPGGPVNLPINGPRGWQVIPLVFLPVGLYYSFATAKLLGSGGA